MRKLTKKYSRKILPQDMPIATFIGMDSIEPHTLKIKTTYLFQEMKSSANHFLSRHVLYGRMRPYLNKVYHATFEGVCSGEFIVLSCNDDFAPELLQYILHHNDFVTFANNKTTGDRPRISYEEIEEYPILKPPLDVQHKIVQQIESRLSICDNIEQTLTQSLQQAEALRQSILKKAFEGKLVPQDPNDEPASVLLKRIKAERAKAEPRKKAGIKTGIKKGK